MQNDGFDRGVVAESLQLTDHRLWRKNDAVEVHHADAIAKAAKPRLSTAGMQCEIDQSEDCQHEQEKAPPPIRTQSSVRERPSDMEKV